jgi:hypothetical protein
MSSVSTGGPAFRHEAIYFVREFGDFRHQFDQLVRGRAMHAIQVILRHAAIDADAPGDEFVRAAGPLEMPPQDSGKSVRAIVGCEMIIHFWVTFPPWVIHRHASIRRRFPLEKRQAAVRELECR